MTINSDTLDGLAVVSLTEGIAFGHVAAALFDLATLALEALRVKGDGQLFLVPLDQVGTIGTDAIMVENSRMTRAVTAEGEFGGLVDFDKLRHLKVVDAAGSLLGTLRDLETDPATGMPLALTIRKGGFLHRSGATVTIDGAAISGVGHDLITVADFVTVADTATAPPTTSVTAPDAATAPHA
jgi:sporulation protein YlmC with PRC-barrel domain